MKYITGNSFKNICNFSLDQNGLFLIKDIEINEIPIWFVKTDYIDTFFNEISINYDFILITHNSDYGINENHLKYLDNKFLKKWYAQNVCINHEKLYSIPIGIANEEWPHGNIEILDSVVKNNTKKSNLIYTNFNINTNIQERSKCLNFIKEFGLNLVENKDFKSYLEDLSESYFVISPNGNGIDCHKTWEALYLKTIPIITKSINSSFYENLPVIIIDDWSKFNIKDFSVERYHDLWYNFDIDKLNFRKIHESILYTSPLFN
jgi:hypothetical protein